MTMEQTPHPYLFFDEETDTIILSPESKEVTPKQLSFQKFLKKYTGYEDELIAVYRQSILNANEQQAYNLKPKLAELQRYKDNVLRQVRHLLLLFSDKQFKCNFPLYRQIFNAFVTGELEQVNQLLMSPKSLKQIKNPTHIAGFLILKAHFLVTNEQFDQAEACFRSAIKHHERYQYLMYYVEYLSSASSVLRHPKQKECSEEEIIPWCLRAMALAETDEQKFKSMEKASFLYSFCEAPVYRQAEFQLYHHQMKYYKKLVAQDAGKYRAYLAECYEYLGNWYREAKHYNTALLFFQKAMEINKGLAVENAGRFLPRMIYNLHCIGHLYRDWNNIPEEERYRVALSYYKKGLTISRQLAEQLPRKHNYALLTILWNLESFGFSTNHNETIENIYLNEWYHYQTLKKKNPGHPHAKRYATELYESLAMFYKNNQQADKAVKIYETLALDEPHKYMHELIYCLNEEAHQTRIIKIYEELAKYNPKDYDMRLSQYLKSAGLSLILNGEDRQTCLKGVAYINRSAKIAQSYPQLPQKLYEIQADQYLFKSIKLLRPQYYQLLVPVNMYE
ncbi:hypothetical protein [uncultured Microscilla sp.]|uniref:hypothetical protein n=1 Tax=uncultured Microscilla sp. TaxID=432653 RepID=UPI00262949A9|nr:hypothetical protein [uncultured Microscilla sp.]